MERKNNIDFIRGIMIILVLVGHSIHLMIEKSLIDASIGNIVYGIIYTFHMPIMFLISGYVFAINIDKTLNEKAFPYIFKNFVSLYIPYLFINFSYWIERYVAFNIFGISLNNELRLNVKSILELFYIGDGITWFLFSLLLVKISDFLIKKYCGDFGSIFIFSILFWMQYLSSNKIIYYLSWGIFFEIGYMIKKNLFDEKEKITKIIIFSIIVALGMYQFVISGFQEDHRIKFIIGIGLFNILLLITSNIKEIPIICLLGKHSIVLFVVHGLTNYIAYLFTHKFTHNGLMIIFGMTIIQCFIAVVVVLLMNNIKWLKWIQVFFYPYKFIANKVKNKN